MKDLSKLLLAGLFTIGFSACSNDELDTGKGANDGPDAVYMQFKLETPETRSTTESDGNDEYVESSDKTEEGLDHESNINKILVLLTNNKNTYIAHSQVNFSNTNPEGVGGYRVDDDTYMVAFRSNKLTNYGGEEIKVYVYCNPTEDLISKVAPEEKFSEDALYNISKSAENKIVEDGTPWANNNFFMSNANNVDGGHSENRTLKLPKTEDFVLYSTPSRFIDLGTIRVERSVARFDYKAGGTNGDNIYPIVENNTGNTVIANIKLTDVALINLSKNFYYLRRVAENVTGDQAETTSTLLGVEKGYENSDNYVVDTDWDVKRNFTPADEMKQENGYYHTNFFYHLTKPSSWNWTSIAEILNEREDHSDWQTTGYHIWRYVTENTIPSVEDQKNAISTGVVFRGQITATNAETDLGKILSADNPTEKIYVFQNKLYGTLGMIEKEIYTDDSRTTFKEENTLTLAYKGAFMELVEENGKQVLKKKSNPQNYTPGKFGFTVYTPENVDDKDGNDGYYAYYYYWNRHNDNSNNGRMGVMEFAVVRNNVYKLSVTGIKKFGHPTPPENPDPNNPDPDPDPIDPDDPDEDENVYFRVAVEVLPWTVRVNNIIF